VLGFLFWLFPDEIFKRVSAGLDEISDDKSALSAAQREEMEAQISADLLLTERFECAVVWHAETRGEILDFRPDTLPMAAIGVRLVTVPNEAAPGTTGTHAFSIIGKR
jgi:hypothetical protein